MKTIVPSKKTAPGSKRKITEPQVRVNALNGRISVYPSELAEEFFPGETALLEGEENDGPQMAGKLFLVTGSDQRGKNLLMNKKGNTKNYYFLEKIWAQKMVEYSKNSIPLCNLKLERLDKKRILNGKECEFFYLNPLNIEQPKEITRKKFKSDS